MIRIKRGLDLPVAGAPEQRIEEAPPVRSVALLGPDYLGLKPAMAVQVGERVQPGQLMFGDRKEQEVRCTAPAAGTVSAIHRGQRRALLSVVIEVNPEAEHSQAPSFPILEPEALSTADPQHLRSTLVEAGLWTALRTRPYGKVPVSGSLPHSLFVNAMDTNPLAADPAVVIGARPEEFCAGLTALCRLTAGRPVYLCKAPGQLPLPQAAELRVEEFVGPHPAGLTGTHIHFLDPVGPHKTVWTIASADVIAIGQLLLTGCLPTERVVALAGPQVERPRLVRTRLGANIEELCAGQTLPGDNRLISGSVLSGHHAAGPLTFLGRRHSQVTVLEEGRQRELLGWLSPGIRRHSSMGIYLSRWLGIRKLSFSTSSNGSERAIVPTGNFERVMPLDVLPTHLLRYLVAGDTAMSRQLGCLELEEEDLALCAYVCSGKYEYGPILREHLTRIEREG